MQFKMDSMMLLLSGLLEFRFNIAGPDFDL